MATLAASVQRLSRANLWRWASRLFVVEHPVLTLVALNLYTWSAVTTNLAPADEMQRLLTMLGR